MSIFDFIVFTMNENNGAGYWKNELKALGFCNPQSVGTVFLGNCCFNSSANCLNMNQNDKVGGTNNKEKITQITKLN